MRYTPLAFVLIYLAFALLLTLFGPIHYFEFATWRVVGYLAAVMAAMTAGYHMAVESSVALPKGESPRSNKMFRNLFYAALLIAFAGFLFTFGYFITSSNINLDVTSIGEAYSESYRGYEKNTGNYSVSFILYSMVAPPVFLTTIWGLRYFFDIPIFARVLSILVIFGTPAIFTLSSGTQKNIGDVFVLLIAVFAIRSAARGRVVTPKTVAWISLVAVTGVFVFAAILGQRYAAIGIGVENINAREINLISYDTNHVIFRLFGPNTGFALSAFAMYLTNGFNGLSYALQTDTTWSYFLGSSYPLSVIGQRFLDLPFMYYQTYPYVAAVETGWGENRWYTAFAWFASDFTFIGTIPLFGFFAYVYGKAWTEVMYFQNPFSMLLFGLLTLGVFYLPANNQLMATPGALLTLATTVGLYLVYRRRFNLAPAQAERRFEAIPAETVGTSRQPA